MGFDDLDIQTVVTFFICVQIVMVAALWWVRSSLKKEFDEELDITLTKLDQQFTEEVQRIQSELEEAFNEKSKIYELKLEAYRQYNKTFRSFVPFVEESMYGAFDYFFKSISKSNKQQDQQQLSKMIHEIHQFGSEIDNRFQEVKQDLSIAKMESGKYLLRALTDYEKTITAMTEECFQFFSLLKKIIPNYLHSPEETEQTVYRDIQNVFVKHGVKDVLNEMFGQMRLELSVVKEEKVDAIVLQERASEE